MLADHVAGIEIVVGRLRPGPLDLALVDALARLRLAARRACWTVGIEGATAELRPLRDLLAYLGLDDLFAFDEEPDRYAATITEVTMNEDRRT